MDSHSQSLGRGCPSHPESRRGAPFQQRGRNILAGHNRERVNRCSGGCDASDRRRGSNNGGCGGKGVSPLLAYVAGLCPSNRSTGLHKSDVGIAGAGF